MKIYLTIVFVNDRAHALDFYTNKLGFVVKNDVPVGTHQWLTVVSTDDPDGLQLLLEPSEHPVVKPCKSGLVADGIPAAPFQVDNIDVEYERMTYLGVEFTQEPMDCGIVRMAVLDDTCGNLIQLVEMQESAG